MPIEYANCPYCDEEQEFELEAISQSEEHEFECENCHKKFKYFWEASIDVITFKKDKW